MPLVRNFADVEQRCIGIGIKKESWFGPFKSNSYAVGLYVNPDLCAKELGIRDRGGMPLVTRQPSADDLPLCDLEAVDAMSKTIQYVLCSKGEEG
eukprot:CAMPEP_0198197546 /NCGR_PEP_ID=MMETSP1445-20131203/1128_1 /TAXON_ID=36898 /ORGANISM="Pyramimonas sp., Strain CCMP2087" /LENGTH=94 /DNA_ID=CAMNT_0043866859 /DNA_START=399 /DNA_END=680 /DNA_ORIENTATION=-